MSSSRSDQTSNTTTTDNRQIVDNGGIAVGQQSQVTINQVPDELIAMQGEVIQSLAKVAEQSKAQQRSDTLQMGDGLVKVGIPAALIAFVILKGKG